MCIIQIEFKFEFYFELNSNYYFFLHFRAKCKTLFIPLNNQPLVVKRIPILTSLSGNDQHTPPSINLFRQQFNKTTWIEKLYFEYQK